MFKGAHRIRIVDTNGMVSTFAGSTQPGWVDGPAAMARFTTPTHFVFDSFGNLFVAERLGHRMRKIDANGMVSTFAGSVAGYRDGWGTNALLHTPGEIAIDANNHLFVPDFDNIRIRKISPEGEVTTFDGSVRGNQDGPLSIATFNTPNSLALRGDGTMFVADWVNGMIRQIGPQGLVSTFAAQLTYIECVRLDENDNIYASLPTGPALHKFDPSGRLQWALNTPSGFRDGPITTAQAGRFNEILFLPDGNILFPDGANHRLRLITLGIPPLLTITPAGGAFTNSVSVNVSTIVTNGSIRYTQDHTDPTPNSVLYTGPISLTNTATFKARVFVNGNPVSDVLTAAFIRQDVPPSSVVQRQLPASYSPGSSFSVSLEANPPANTVVYALQDQPPMNWIVSNISHNGSYDALNRLVKFGPFLVSSDRCRYRTDPARGSRRNVPSGLFRGFISLAAFDHTPEPNG